MLIIQIESVFALIFYYSVLTNFMEELTKNNYESTNIDTVLWSLRFLYFDTKCIFI